MNILLIILCVILLGLYVIKMRNFKMSTKVLVTIAMCTAMSYILSCIPFIKYPQGGGIGLVTMLPIFIVSVLYGSLAGVTTGLLYGLLSLIGGSTLIHLAQIMLDYILPAMAYGLAGVCGTDKKTKIFIGGIIAVILAAISQTISGYVFFAEYAPEGMNPLIYSLGYNLSGKGVEGVIASVIVTILPIERFRKAANA